MKKLFFLSLMALSTLSIDSYAQNSTYYVGSSRVFALPYVYQEIYYAAEMYHQTGNGSGGYTYYFSSVDILGNDGTTYNYHSSHGNYILFNYRCSDSGFLTYSEQVIFQKAIGGIRGYFAFVIEGNKLQLVNVQTDEIVSTLDYNITDGYMGILVVNKAIESWREGYLTILVSHNGYLKRYDELPVPSRIDNAPAENVNSDKKYNLEGIEIESNSEGIFIQDGKKILNKK